MCLRKVLDFGYQEYSSNRSLLLRSVTSQKKEDLIYTATETLNRA